MAGNAVNPAAASADRVDIQLHDFPARIQRGQQFQGLGVGDFVAKFRRNYRAVDQEVPARAVDDKIGADITHPNVVEFAGDVGDVGRAAVFLRQIALAVTAKHSHRLITRDGPRKQAQRGLYVRGKIAPNGEPGLLLDAACAGLGIALVSQLLSRKALADGQLQPLVEHTIRGPNWALLTHRDSENNARSFSEWLVGQLQR